MSAKKALDEINTQMEELTTKRVEAEAKFNKEQAEYDQIQAEIKTDRVFNTAAEAQKAGSLQHVFLALPMCKEKDSESITAIYNKIFPNLLKQFTEEVMALPDVKEEEPKPDEPIGAVPQEPDVPDPKILTPEQIKAVEEMQASFVANFKSTIDDEEIRNKVETFCTDSFANFTGAKRVAQRQSEDG